MTRYIRTILKTITPFLIIMLFSSNIIFAAENNARSSFKWWWEDEVPKLEGIEKDKFSETKGGYVYNGAELKNGASYDFEDQTLYIQSNINIPIPTNYKAEFYIPSVTFNAKKVVVECDLNIYSKKVIFNSDLVIQNNGAIDLNSKTIIDIHGDFIANSKKISNPSAGIINVYGNIELKKNWITSTVITQKEERTGPTINVIGNGEHIIKGSNKCSVKKLSFSSDSIKNTRFKTGFLFFKSMFLIDDLCLEYSKKTTIAQSFIDKYFICTDVEPGINSNLTTAAQVTATESYEFFAKSFLFSLIMSTECQDSKVNIFETYYHTKKSKNDIGIYAFNIKDRPIIVNNNRGELNKGTITINYIGVGQKINDNGMADIIIDMENGGRCHYWFTPKLSKEKEDVFLDTLRAGASDVIWDQAIDVLFSQVLSDITELCDVFDYSKGTIICKNIEKVRFFDDLQDHIDDWNKVENGLISERKDVIPAKEEHSKGANEISSEGHSDDMQVENDDESKQINPYIEAIDNLISQYGSLCIIQNNGEWQNEANGLCYLNLIDFTGDGDDELMAVCKNEDEEHYSCFVYQQINNQAKQVFYNEQIECNFDYDYETVYISSSKDTGYVIGSGWEGDDAEDTTFYWCNKDGYFEPVYHLKGYWDTDQDEFVSEEKAIVIDLFDDDHRDEIWNNHKSITLRTYDEYDADGDFFNTQKLQKTIDDTLRKLRADTKDLPLIEDGIDDMLPLVNAQVNFFRQESESANHITSCKKEDDFWKTLGSYCNSNLISGNNTNEVFLQDGEVVISSAEIIDMGYSLFDDFEGVIPDTEFDEYGPINYVEDEDAYHFLPASMHDYIYKEKSEPILNDDETITITYLYEESFWGNREGPETFAYDITFRLNDHVNMASDNPYYYTIISVEKLTESKKNESVADSDDNKVYEYVLSQLHGLWYSSTMGPDGPMSKMICEGNDFNGEIHEIVEYNEGYLVRLVDGYSYYFGKDLDSCILVEGWDITENNTSGASGWWKPNEEQRKQYGD